MEPGGSSRLFAAYWRLTELLDLLARGFMIFLVVVILIFTGGQAIDRYLLHTSFDAYDQIARLGLVWLTFFGYALGYRDRVNLRIELLDMALGPRARFVKQIVFDIWLLALVALINQRGWLVMEVGGSQAILGTPFDYSMVYGGLQFSTLLLLVFVALRLGGALYVMARTGQIPHLPAPHA